MDDPTDCSGPPAAEDSHGHDLRHCAWCFASAPTRVSKMAENGPFYKGVGWAFYKV